ncbi:MAG: RagB/SusD family nutrient uptake outer membrane protein, partial [Saprospiraceae bacterium]|nr:RagB/SusD family nutrient uptake outer membrane protein [Saprospiraceae bacterium]
MKNIKSIKYASLLLILSLVACKKEFLERVPQDALTVDNFYSSPKALDAATAILYNYPWFDFNDKAIWSYGDLMSGNMNTYDPQVTSFKTFDVTGDNTRLMEGWRALFNVVAHANGIINDLPKKATAVSPSQVARCVGEARFMRALAYFYLVRLWGAVPIIENNSEKIYDAQIPRNNVEDIYKLMVKDLEYAEANCPAKSSYGGSDKARVSNGAAKALLAKVYLYQKNYDKALEKAEQVINSNEYKLMAEYEDIFKSENNVNLNPSVNTETIFALLWDVDNGGWGVQNTNQAYFAPFGEGITGFGDGWGSVFTSIDLVRAYESGDKRKRATIMTPGTAYSYMSFVKNGTEVTGYTYPETRFLSDTRSHVKKYVVGSPAGNKGKGGFMRTFINTNILRLSEVYLIAAEAIAKGGATTDAKAVGYFNTVRKRAGLIEKSSLNFDDIIRERRTELAMEGDYWYDLCRMDRKKAIDIIKNQERGVY